MFVYMFVPLPYDLVFTWTDMVFLYSEASYSSMKGVFWERAIKIKLCFFFL